GVAPAVTGGAQLDAALAKPHRIRNLLRVELLFVHHDSRVFSRGRSLAPTAAPIPARRQNQRYWRGLAPSVQWASPQQPRTEGELPMKSINAEDAFELMYELLKAHPWLNQAGVMKPEDAHAETE